MAVRPLGEQELARLEVLTKRQRLAKEGTAEKLLPAERLELRELRARKGASVWVSELAKVEARKRRNENRAKYHHGGLLAKAGISTWSDDELVGGFLAMAAVSPAQRARFEEQGRRFNSKPKEQPVRLRVTFPEQPESAMLIGLRKRKFQFDPVAVCWTGTGLLSEIQAEAALSGGTVEVIEQGAAAAS